MNLMPDRIQTLFGPGRVVVWVSCGIASAMAAKLAIEHYGSDAVVLVYCDTSKSEHLRKVTGPKPVEEES